MPAPLLPVYIVVPQWVRTSTAGGAFSTMPDSTSLPPASDPEDVIPAPAATSSSELQEPELGFQPLPPPPPQHFPTLRSEDSRVALTNDGLEINDELFGWRELEGVDVQPVRWLLGVLLGGFVLCGFMLGYLQFWLHSMPAALGMGAGALLLVWGVRGTNRWRLHRPGREPRHFAFAGPARSWQQLASEANLRIRQRHNEAAATAAYWLHEAAQPPFPAPDAPTVY
ncbi:hypothetical protein [Hymenobacter sublimis]|uniref:Uncharacterized protein n=1 Tax=Hymenobacter sublimis TaxID=2933777 RepID=A0ABY4JDA0_9BACT|nr:hypothetical protein [Hymenobacter sublimis]UPL50799.1 hypothetical protein MWH26_07815 [Hymenobacter sublimis]